jgi:outer membrane protein OmpA-like peptidoglycan-associated protein
MKSFIYSTMIVASVVVTDAYACAEHRAAYGGGHDAVRNFSGDVIRNTWQNCVITKWQSGEAGCDAEVKEAISTELLSVYFDFDSAVLTPVAQEKLDQMVALLHSAPHVKNVDVVGYADHLGNSDYNYALSLRRANAVRAYLASKGYVNTQKVFVEALGSSQPVAQCNGLAGSAEKSCLWRDRRVEIKLNFGE